MAQAVIPWELVEACRLPEQEVEEGSAFGEQQGELRRAQLLERLGEGMYRLHPLVRRFVELQGRQPSLVVVRDRWRQQWARAVAAVCREKFEQFMPLKKQTEVEVYMPHISQVAMEDADFLRDEDLIGTCAQYLACFSRKELITPTL